MKTEVSDLIIGAVGMLTAPIWLTAIVLFVSIFFTYNLIKEFGCFIRYMIK